MKKGIKHAHMLLRDAKRGEGKWTADDYKWLVDRLMKLLDVETEEAMLERVKATIGCIESVKYHDGRIVYRRIK